MVIGGGERGGESAAGFTGGTESVTCDFEVRGGLLIRSRAFVPAFRLVEGGDDALGEHESGKVGVGPWDNGHD